MEKSCPRCYIGCNDKALICHSCGFAFSKLKRIWLKLVNMASIFSLFIGLLIVVANQSSQLIEGLKTTEFTSLGIKSAQGTNRLITENFALGIDSGTGVLLERVTFMGSDSSSNTLKVAFIHGQAYNASDVATIKIKPTAIHLSYRPAPLEMIHMLLESGIKKEKIADLFKIRPTSSENQIYKKYPWAAISGKVQIDYFEPKRNSAKRLTKEYPAQLLLWGRKLDNLSERLRRKSYSHIDIDSVIKKYNKIIEKNENRT
jgi:hypothetical protein